MPLWHLFEALDGSTSGPRGFSGSIGRQLETCTRHPVTCFKTVRLTEPLSNLDPKELSIDQQYIYLKFAIVSAMVTAELIWQVKTLDA